MTSRLLFGLPSLLIATSATSVAWASSFTEDGEFQFDPDALITQDFDDPIIPEEGGESLTIEDPSALSGNHVLKLGVFEGGGFDAELPESAARYRISAWIRGSETIGDIEIRYADNPHAGVDEIAELYPTGRVTSDGWVEVENDHIFVEGTRGATVEVGFFSTGGGFVDGVEIVALGDLKQEERSGAVCQGSADPTCGIDQTCMFSQCRYVGGSVPGIPADREKVTAYLRARIELLFGPLLNRKIDLPNSQLALDAMTHATTPWEYWNAFTLAVRRLHDGHTSTSSIGDFVFENERPIGLCFIEGDADLSHSVAPKDPFYLDVLVSHTAASRTLGLNAGDRLVAIDGRHPIAWARAQVQHHWGMSPVSNHQTFAELAESMRGLIARYAQTISIVRCDGELGTCGELEEIDISALPPVAPDEGFESVQCDNRPLRHLPTSPANHAGGGSTVHFGRVLESNEVERIYGAEWESLYATSSNDGSSAGLNMAIEQFKAEARGVIFDHRTGNGGTNLGPVPIWNFTVPRRPTNIYVDRIHWQDEEPDLANGLAFFQQAVDDNFVEYSGSNDPTTMPVALLITRDVSASDWLPLGLKGGSPNVKIFGPFQTNGAFSTRYGFGYWLGVNYVIATGDTFDATGQTRNGRGVEPDIIVLPRQSDLIAGRDTVFEAAMQWIRQSLSEVPQ